MELVAFLWVVGWLYTCGIASVRMDEKGVEAFSGQRFTVYGLAIVGWPFYLGASK